MHVFPRLQADTLLVNALGVQTDLCEIDKGYSKLFSGFWKLNVITAKQPECFLWFDLSCLDSF